jgi:outer membrane protein assembly factor BamE (lipoprotein component of BamABCDE complex)
MLPRTTIATLAVALAAGCTTLGLAKLQPGTSTEADVRAVLGEPAKTYAGPEGTRQLAYPQGPEGTQTFMVFLSPDGRLLRVEQVLSEEHFRRITLGATSAGQLERLLGPPWRTVDFPNKRAVAWDYVFRDTWGYMVDFSVMVGRDGVVTETAYVRRERGNNEGSGFSGR